MMHNVSITTDDGTTFAAVSFSNRPESRVDASCVTCRVEAIIAYCHTCETSEYWGTRYIEHNCVYVVQCTGCDAFFGEVN